MTSTAELRVLWDAYLCDPTFYGRVSFPGPDKTWSLYVARPAVEAFSIMAEIMATTPYLFRESAGGTYNCRRIANTTSYSLHAYAIAIDINPSKNPYRTCTTDMPKAFTDAVLALRTRNGKRVFSWGGNWRPCSNADPMHFQADCGPDDMATGIVWPSTPGDDDMPTPEELALAVWRHGYKVDEDGSELAPSAWQYLIRTKANTDAILGEVRHLSDGELMEIANAVNDELARRARE